MSDDDLGRYSDHPPDNRELHRALTRVDDMWSTHEDMSKAFKLVAGLGWLLEPISLLAKNKWVIGGGIAVASWLQIERIEAALAFLKGFGG